MDKISCPHCKAEGRFGSRVPKNVVAVLPCPKCGELVVLFRSQTIALDRRVLESGTMEERKLHLAEVIGEFLEMSGGLPLEPGDIGGFSTQLGEDSYSSGDDELEYGDVEPISEQEMDKFVRIDLKCIDNGAYFRRHFG